MGCKQSIKEQFIVKINKSSDIGELDQIWSDAKKEFIGKQRQWKVSRGIDPYYHRPAGPDGRYRTGGQYDVPSGFETEWRLFMDILNKEVYDCHIGLMIINKKSQLYGDILSTTENHFHLHLSGYTVDEQKKAVDEIKKAGPAIFTEEKPAVDSKLLDLIAPRFY